MSLQKNKEDADEEENEDGEDEEGDAMDDLPKEILQRVRYARKLHEKVEEIDQEYKMERLELEKKFLAKRQVIFDERSKIISGEMEAPVEEEGH